MYLSFYNLNSKPFPEKTDPARLWLNEKTKKELTAFRDEIMENRGILLLTGDVGVGKTSFINILVSSLPENILVGNVVNPGLDPQGILQVLADIFRLPKEASEQDNLLSSFKQFLIGAAADNKRVLLVIDEAQQLTDNLLQLIRQLNDLQDNGSKLLSTILVGQNDFNTILFKPENNDLRQKITVTHNIVPLTKVETDQYIKHHLRLAGGEEDLFSPEALAAVFTITGGSPRLINLICDLVLLNGFTSESPVITKELVSDCAKKLMLPHGKMIQPKPIAAHKTEKVSKQTFSRRRKTGWLKPSFGLLILIVLILFGARQLVNRMEMPDDTVTTSIIPAHNETVATPMAEIPQPTPEESPMAAPDRYRTEQIAEEIKIAAREDTPPNVHEQTRETDELAAEHTLESQPAAKEKIAARPAQENAPPEDKAIQIAAAEDTPPNVHEQPREAVEPAVEHAESSQSTAAETPAAVHSKDSASAQDKTIQIAAAEDTPPVLPKQPQKTAELVAVPAITSQPPAAEPTAATPAKDSKEKVTAKTLADSPMISQEKPVPEKIKAAPEISIDSDPRNGAKKILTVFFGNLRDGPSVEANVIGVAKQGDIVIDLVEKENWHFVKLEDGRLGWMHQSLFAPRQEIAIEKVEEPAAPSATDQPASAKRATQSQTLPKIQVTVQPLAEKGAQPEKEESPAPLATETSPPQTAPAQESPGSASVKIAQKTTSTPSVPPPTEKPIVKTDNPEALEWTQKSFESVSLGRYDIAIDEATKAIELDPGLVNPYINRAWAYCETGFYEKAIADGYTALALEPKNALALNNLGLAFHRMEQLAKAREYYQKACDLELDVACSNYKLLLPGQ